MAHNQKFILKEKLLTDGQEVICAISGGVDSMSLASVLVGLKYKVRLAHFNFKLRGVESDEDESFIRFWAAENGITCYVETIPNPDFWKKEAAGKNIQEEARRLRYNWFEQLKDETGIEKIALAHHADDQVETILIQTLRGTGISGLRGMLPERDGFIRPFLGVTKNEIVSYARGKVKTWRSDSSNESDKYRRNEIRHQLWPVLEAIAPGFEKVVLRNAQKMREVETASQEWFRELKLRFSKTENESQQVFDFEAIRNSPSGTFFLGEVARENGFDFSVVEEWATASFSTESRIWNSVSGMKIELKGSDFIVCRTNRRNDFEGITIHDLNWNEIEVSGFGILQLVRGDMNQGFGENSTISQPTDWKAVPKNECWLDADKLKLPLTIRKWQHGDQMKPFGMKGKSKLVSDILTENSLTQLEKESVLKLSDADGNLIWLPKIRSAEPFKIDDQTKKIVCLRWKEF